MNEEYKMNDLEKEVKNRQYSLFYYLDFFSDSLNVKIASFYYLNFYTKIENMT